MQKRRRNNRQKFPLTVLEKTGGSFTERLGQIEGVTRVVTAHVLEMIRYTYDWGRGPLG